MNSDADSDTTPVSIHLLAERALTRRLHSRGWVSSEIAAALKCEKNNVWMAVKNAILRNGEYVYGVDDLSKDDIVIDQQKLAKLIKSEKFNSEERKAMLKANKEKRQSTGLTKARIGHLKESGGDTSSYQSVIATTSEKQQTPTNAVSEPPKDDENTGVNADSAQQRTLRDFLAHLKPNMDLSDREGLFATHGINTIEQLRAFNNWAEEHSWNLLVKFFSQETGDYKGFLDYELVALWQEIQKLW